MTERDGDRRYIELHDMRSMRGAFRSQVLGSKGRGANYTRRRGVVEAMLRVAYRGDWPARMWARVPASCEVRVVRRSLPMLARGERAMRIGFVSDIHIGPTTPDALLDAAFDALAREELDVLLLGGDYVFLEATPAKAERLARLVARVPARVKLAVMGNHDLWTHHVLLERALASVDVRVLCNDRVELARDLHVVGLDDPWTGRIDANAFRGASAKAIVVLCHSPDGLPDATRALAELPRARALYICGHTHGGHLAAPWGPLVVPGRLGKTFHSGFHDVPPFVVHVSRGVGGIEIPMRTFAPPEVAVLDLVPS